MARKAWSIRGLTLLLAIALLALYAYVIKPHAPPSLPDWVPVVILVVLWIAGGIVLQLRDINLFNQMARQLGLARIPESEAHAELSPRAHRGRYRDRSVMVDLKIPQASKYARSRFFAKVENGRTTPRLVVQRKGGPGTGGKDLPPAVDMEATELNDNWRVYCEREGVARAALTGEACAALAREHDLVEVDTVDGRLRGEVHDRVLDPGQAQLALDTVTALAEGLERAMRR